MIDESCLVKAPTPSATTLLLRQCSSGFDVLLLKKNVKLNYGGTWVFPGGRIDEGDFVGCTNDALQAARRAAVRETYEEAGLVISEEKLVWFSHWTTPVIRPRRFSTWFFVAPYELGDVQIDGGEIHDHVWISPLAALEAHKIGEIKLSPPVFVTLTQLNTFSSMSDVIAVTENERTTHFAPRVNKVPTGECHLYQGDSGYETSQPECDDRRHRLWVNQTGTWVYEQGEVINENGC